MNDPTLDAHGPLALLGGGEFSDGVALDGEILANRTDPVLILATAAAYEHPDKLFAAASGCLEAHGSRASYCPVLRRQDAENEHLAAQVRSATAIYLTSGSPLHLRSVLKDSLVLHALIGAWRDGAVLVGSGAGAMVLSDPMLDPRGGAFTVGLGLVRNFSVLPYFSGEITPQVRRTISLAPSGSPLVGVPAKTAIVRESSGMWRVSGAGEVAVFLDGEPAGLEVLAGKAIE